MKKIYWVICGKHKKIRNPTIRCIFGERLVLSIMCSKCRNEDAKVFKEEESIEKWKILGLIENI